MALLLPLLDYPTARTTQTMTQYYAFFIRDSLPQPGAHLVQMVQCANAAANLGYPTLLIYVKTGPEAFNPLDWIHPFRPQPPSPHLKTYYSLGDNSLQVLPLALPWPIDQIQPPRRWSNASTWVCKYYLPWHLMRHIRLVHTRDWNFAQVAIQHSIPAIYERDHLETKTYPAAIAQHPLLQTAVTVVDSVGQDMAKNGIPADKIVTLHNGYNRLFAKRQPEQAAAWRSQLLTHPQHRLVVYSGALYPFKGVDLLLAIAKDFPTVHFAFAGGPEEQRRHYEDVVRDRMLTNVSFLGFIAQEKLASLLQAADVLAHPHLKGHAATFTSPMKFFDYMASGTPIIASDIPTMAEFKSAGIVAAWCQPNDPHSFAHSLRQVLNTDAQTFVNTAGRKAFMHQFSWEHRITQVLNRVAPHFRPQIIHA